MRKCGPQGYLHRFNKKTGLLLSFSKALQLLIEYMELYHVFLWNTW